LNTTAIDDREDNYAVLIIVISITYLHHHNQSPVCLIFSLFRLLYS